MNTQTKKEILNYFRYILRKPDNLLSCGETLFRHRKEIVKRLLKKPALQARMPEYVSCEDKFSGDIKLSGNEESNKFPVNGKKRFSSIKIASGELDIDGDIPWEHEFDDTEDHESLHRWMWLLYKVSEDPSSKMFQDAVLYIKNWILRYGFEPDDTLKWNAYTTSERICNSIVIFEKNGLVCEQIISDGLKVMAQHVANNLEYYGPVDTFNHILNNARALYVYGSFFDDIKFRDLAIDIFKNELPRIITKDGFLREGSSHYQFVVTRWLLEVMCFAQYCKDDTFIAEFKDIVSSMVKQCHFFIVKDLDSKEISMPLVGDISPDVVPDWLKYLPFSNLASSFYVTENYDGEVFGWAKIFNESLNSCEPIKEDQKQDSIHLIYDDSGWFRFIENDVDIFVYMRPRNNFRNRGHYHNDMMSFCLFLKGKPVLIDCGRFNYRNTDEGKWGESAFAHNSIVVDDFEPFPFSQSSYLWKVFSPKDGLFSFLTHEETDSVIKVVLKCEGFKRLGTESVDVLRIIKISKEEKYIEIEDSVTGIKEHNIKARYYCGQGLSVKEVSPNNFNISGEGLSLNMVSTNIEGSIVDPSTCYVCFQYGKKTSIPGLSFESFCKLPQKFKYNISWS